MYFSLSLDHILKALSETDIQGVFNDLLQLFLTTLFRYQEVEPDPVDVKNKKITSNLICLVLLLIIIIIIVVICFNYLFYFYFQV